jgi:hypothetical protein
MEAMEMLTNFLKYQKKRCLTSTPSSFLLTGGSVDSVIKFIPSVYPA